jgi:hypothetical protein
LGAKEQLAHDQQRPAVADQVQRMGRQTAFVVADARGFAFISH